MSPIHHVKISLSKNENLFGILTNLKVRFMGAGESKILYGFGFRGFVFLGLWFCDLRLPHKPNPKTEP